MWIVSTTLCLYSQEGSITTHDYTNNKGQQRSYRATALKHDYCFTIWNELTHYWHVAILSRQKFQPGMYHAIGQNICFRLSAPRVQGRHWNTTACYCISTCTFTNRINRNYESTKLHTQSHMCATIQRLSWYVPSEYQARLLFLHRAGKAVAKAATALYEVLRCYNDNSPHSHSLISLAQHNEHHIELHMHSMHGHSLECLMGTTQQVCLMMTTWQDCLVMTWDECLLSQASWHLLMKESQLTPATVSQRLEHLKKMKSAV